MRVHVASAGGLSGSNPGLGDYYQEQEAARVAAVVAGLLAGQLQNDYWGVALTNPQPGAPGTLSAGRGWSHAAYFDAPYFGNATDDSRVAALLQQQVDLYERLAAEHPAVTVLWEGSNPPGGSGPQRPILLLNVRTGATRWMSGYSPAEVAARGGAGAGFIPAGIPGTGGTSGGGTGNNTGGGSGSGGGSGNPGGGSGGGGETPGGSGGDGGGFSGIAIAAAAAGVAALILLGGK